VAEGLAMLDSAVGRAKRRSGGTARGYSYMTGPRALPLLRLGRLADARAALQESERALRTTLPDGHRYCADLALWQGAVSLTWQDADSAEAHFRDVLRRLALQFPDGHPKVSTAGCLLGVALVRQGRLDEARPHLGRQCPAYERWGPADPLLTAWSRQARAAVGGARSGE
jgi:Flp pilus assembly protein TadD